MTSFLRATFFCLMVVCSGVVSFSIPANSAQAQTVQSIVIKGNKRITPETIRSYLELRPGGRYDPFLVDESLKSLFSTGLFKDVQISRNGGTVIVIVEENPIVNRVAFEGNRKIKDEQLAGEIQLQSRSVYSQTVVQRDLVRILASYRAIGRYGASVDPKIITLPDNRVNVVFEINEATKSRISSITVIGNQAFTDSTLHGLLSTKESGLLTLLNRKDVYDSNKLESDQEILRRFYLSKGYADFRVLSAVADFDQSRNAFFITITVDEGQKYSLGDVEVHSSVVSVDPEMLRQVLKTHTGDVYNADLVDKSLEELTFTLSAQGYAFAQVRPRGTRDPDNQLIHLSYIIEEGARVYIEQINIRGNTRTLENVLRREFDFAEGDPYNSVLINLAKKRLEALQFFESVRISRNPGSSPDRVILVVDLVEKATGDFSIGFGYQSDAGLVGDVRLSETNFLGRGQQVVLALRKGQRLSDYEFSFTEPYFLERRISAGFDIFRKTIDRTRSSGYESFTNGGRLRLGFKMSDHLYINTRYFYEDRSIDLDTGSYISPVILFSDQDTVTSGVGYTITHSDLDNVRIPRNGHFTQFKQDFTGLGGEARYMRSEVEATIIREIHGDFIGFIKLRAGHVIGFGDDVNIYDTFFMGGDLVRGFAVRGLGPRYVDGVDDSSIGGTTYFGATAEIRFPLPMIPKDFGMFGAVFADAGTLFDVGEIGSLSAAQKAKIFDDVDIRSSIGLGVIWHSPFGPIRIDYGYALSSTNYDDKQSFRFGTASRF